MNYIYCFTNLINQKKYIGSTIKEPNRRYNEHLYHVNNQTDKSHYPLYSAIRKYGIENFTFEILEEKECSEEEIRIIEHDYIVRYNTVSPNGYNQTDNTIHPLMDENIIKKVSETKRENAKRVARLDPETKEILDIHRSIADCAENLNIDEKKIGACCRGERLTTSNYMFYWLDDNNNLIIPEYKRDVYKGKKGTTQIQSSSRKVAKLDLKTNQILKIYDTIALAARENDCDSSGISKACKGIRKSVKGYKWIYIDE